MTQSFEVVRVEIAKLAPKPGEMLVFRVPKEWFQAPDGVNRFADYVGKALQDWSPGIKALLLPDDVEVQFVAAEQIEQSDIQRAIVRLGRPWSPEA
jgi:hypothetical protein